MYRIHQHTITYRRASFVKRIVGRKQWFSYNRIHMTKDAPLAFRISTDLKKRLLKLAKQEARSLSQICEMLLKIGADEYDKDGHKYLQRVLVSKSEKDQA